ncbi:hypothetical protein PZA11_005878 [Diplocarpon coronariae]
MRRLLIQALPVFEKGGSKIKKNRWKGTLFLVLASRPPSLPDLDENKLLALSYHSTTPHTAGLRVQPALHVRLGLISLVRSLPVSRSAMAK